MDSFYAFDGLIYIHSFYKSCNTLGISGAAADIAYIGEFVIDYIEMNFSGAYTFCFINHNLVLHCIWVLRDGKGSAKEQNAGAFENFLHLCTCQLYLFGNVVVKEIWTAANFPQIFQSSNFQSAIDLGGWNVNSNLPLWSEP